MIISEFKPTVEVLVRFAQALIENGPMKITPLYFATRLSWYSFQNYMNWLTNNDYVKRKADGKRVTYEFTQDGFEVFNNLLQIKEQFLVGKNL